MYDEKFKVRIPRKRNHFYKLTFQHFNQPLQSKVMLNEVTQTTAMSLLLCTTVLSYLLFNAQPKLLPVICDRSRPACVCVAKAKIIKVFSNLES